MALSNPIATGEQLLSYKSLSPLPQDLLDAVYFSTQCLTQAAGMLLQLPQSVTAQASVVLARFWLVHEPMTYEFSDISAASIYLIAKLGPSPRSPRDVSNVYAYLLSPVSPFLRPNLPPAKNDPATYYQPDSAYQTFHTRVLALEGQILSALGFDTHVALPHPLAITYLQALDFLHHPRGSISRQTIEYLNSALLSPQMLYLTHQPSALAVAAIYNAARDVGAKMPECEWWEVFDVDREDLGFLVMGMRSLEGSIRVLRDALPGLRKGMITRKMVEEELARRAAQQQSNG